MPLFLEMVREVAGTQPALAQHALEGLKRYRDAPRAPGPPPRPALAAVAGSSLRDHGGDGPPLVLVPSLINPAHVLDLPGRSLAITLAQHRRVLLVDWGCAARRSDLDLGGHVEQRLAPLLDAVGEPVDLIGYCLGGTLAIAAAAHRRVRSLVTLAAPWRFAAYPADARARLTQLWRRAETAATALGVLPTEVLQIAFWSIDPHGLVSKFARLAAEPADSAVAARFVAIEDWANDGEPMPLPAARELIGALFTDDRTGAGEWRVGGQIVRVPDGPSLHFTASGDRIVPEASAPPGPTRRVGAGHVGMIVGGRAPVELHRPLIDFLGAVA